MEMDFEDIGNFADLRINDNPAEGNNPADGEYNDIDIDDYLGDNYCGGEFCGAGYCECDYCEGDYCGNNSKDNYYDIDVDGYPA